jgi:pilus assembly protein CpaE
MLTFDENIKVVDVAPSGREAIAKVKTLDPDVVLMDINMPDMDGITATQHIRQRFPYTQVVMLSVQNDPSYMRRAMRAGAHDFLPKPPQLDELIAVVKRAGAISHEQRSMVDQMSSSTDVPGGPILQPQQGKIITVYSPKGGVGTTTLASNLALALRLKKLKVLLIDANNQFGTIPLFFSLRPRNSVIDLISRIDELDAEILKEVITVHEASGLEILAAPPRPEMADQVNGESFGKLLSYVKRYYNFIIIDTASYLDETTLTAIEKSEITVLLSSLEIPSLRNVNAFSLLYQALGYNPRKVVFVLNLYDRKSGISLERISESLSMEIFMALPLDDKLVLREAVKRGIPVMVDNQAHIFSKNIYVLSTKLQERITQMEEIIV